MFPGFRSGIRFITANAHVINRICLTANLMSESQHEIFPHPSLDLRYYSLAWAGGRTGPEVDVRSLRGAILRFSRAAGLGPSKSSYTFQIVCIYFAPTYFSLLITGTSGRDRAFDWWKEVACIGATEGMVEFEDIDEWYGQEKCDTGNDRQREIERLAPKIEIRIEY